MSELKISPSLLAATDGDVDGAQKLGIVMTDDIDGIDPGVFVIAATTRDRGLQVDTVDLREFIPGVTASTRRGTRLVTDVPSFLAELDRYPMIADVLEGSGSLWGDETKGRIEAIYNDHSNETRGLRDNRLRLELRADEDWVAWHRLSGEYMPQEKFGDAVEELLHTVTDPSQAELLEVIDSVRATTKGSFESSISRADGGQSVAFKEDVSATAGKSGRLEVPQVVTLALRPWEGLERYEVKAWFRLRVQNGQLFLAIKLKPTRNVQRTAWADVVSQIEDHLDGKPVLATRF